MAKAKPQSNGEAAAEMPDSFEEGLDELDRLVNGLERGELTLDESVAAVERGTRLLTVLNEKIRVAETRIRELVETDDGPRESSIDLPERDDA